MEDLTWDDLTELYDAGNYAEEERKAKLAKELEEKWNVSE